MYTSCYNNNSVLSGLNTPIDEDTCKQYNCLENNLEKIRALIGLKSCTYIYLTIRLCAPDFYSNSKVFLSRKYRLIVTPQKFDVLIIRVFSAGGHYLNNRVFLSRNYRLIVAPRKFDVLKTNICPRSEASKANMLVLRTVPTNYKGFCARLGPCRKSRSLQGLLEFTKKNRGSHAFFRDN